jgi:hypothetical protein
VVVETMAGIGAEASDRAGAKPLALQAKPRNVFPAGLYHFGFLVLVGFVPYLMVAIVLAQLVAWFTRASHNEAIVVGLALSLYVTPILLRPVSDFMRGNMTYWRPEKIGSLPSQRWRHLTLLAGLAILPWLVLRFGLEALLLALATMTVDTAFWNSAGFASYFTLLLMWRAAPELKRLLYPELLAADLARAAVPKVAYGDPAIHRRLVDIAELAKRRLDIARGKLLRQDEGVHTDTGKESDLIAEIMPADADLALIAEPRAQ